MHYVFVGTANRPVSRMGYLKSPLLWVGFLAVVFVQASNCSAGLVYLALGDSVTYGLDPSTPSTLTPSFADQGFVRPLADYLAIKHGVRPEVKNLAIPGELSSSFFSGTVPSDWNNRVVGLNQNYDAAPVSQHQLMQSTILQAHANGDSIGYVSLLFGSNDVFQRVATSEFQNATPEEQQLLLGQTINDVLGNYQSVLNELLATAPEAQILLPNYYNPYPDFVPESQLYESILASFNPAVEQLANAYGASYVDFYTVFDGRALELTNIGTLGDVHPNQLGYQAAGGAMISAVPEPSAAVAWAGLLLVGLVSRRRPSR